MSLYTYNGTLLAVNGQLAIDQPCCCGSGCPPVTGFTLKYSGGPHGTEYHCCDLAVFKCYVENIFIGDVNLNNGSTCDDVVVTLTITEAQAAQIAQQRRFMDDCCVLRARLDCNLPWYYYGCHSQAADLEIYDAAGKCVFAGQAGTSTVHANICGEPKWYCNQSAGCRRSSASGIYDTQADCEAANCIEYAYCDNSYYSYVTGNHCSSAGFYTSPPYTGSVTRAVCEQLCMERWSCSATSGCYSIGYALYGAESIEACDFLCQVQSYTCDSSSGCQPRYDLSGEFSAYGPCMAVCLERATCDTYSGCQYAGYGTTGIVYANCAQECFIQSYTCDYNFGCQPRYDRSGEFSTSGDCGTACLPRAFCDTYSGCQYAGYGTTGILYANCNTDCVIQSYTCNIDIGCQGFYNSNAGEYQTLSSCQDACLPRYQCQVTAYSLNCAYTGYSPTGQTIAECSVVCAANSYNCHPSYGCVPSQAAGGTFATAQDCYANCGWDYHCYYYAGYYAYFCLAPTATISPQSYEQCLVNCPPQEMRMLPTDTQTAAYTDANWLKTASATTQPSAAQNLTTQTFVSSRPAPPKTLEEQDPNGPGTLLSKTLEKIGIKSSPTCSCKARARIMNDRGNDWCEENIEEIVGWLREEATKRKLPFIDMAGRLLIRRAISLSRAAKKKQQTDESTTTDRADS